MIEYRVTGLSANSVPYLEALELQRETHAAVVRGSAPDTVLLLEHPSVYTAGKRTEASERPDDGTPVIDVDRGGKITWHGPGQLVGYPIMRLPQPVDVVAFVRQLEQVLIDVVAEFGVEGHRVDGRSGVWVSQTTDAGEPAPDAKIAAIGLRVAEGVTMHGFALNCSNGLEPYDRIVACGIRDAGVTTLSRELARRGDTAIVDPEAAVPVVQRCFEHRFAQQVVAA
ncbi:lipoyl(octanoyl) transferase LipB [Gryllotalpicola reticulitermitis]|uniref:Octanoyltransferase n=1 Tax=Gryllotalpicola reticulitermitis TaxID=1184153 RepID=A0ABV8QAG2_9MICO